MANSKHIVQKFGGTSVKDARAIKIVREHDMSARPRPLVVLSACTESLREEEMKISAMYHCINPKNLINPINHGSDNFSTIRFTSSYSGVP